MRTVSIISLVFVITLYFSIISMVDSRAAWLCAPCLSDFESTCDNPPTSFCFWGEARDPCGRRVCAKGPGERCGGHREILGKCGTGMWCQKESETTAYTCHGCYDNRPDECHKMFCAVCDTKKVGEAEE